MKFGMAVLFCLILATAAYFISLPNVEIVIIDELFGPTGTLKHREVILPARNWRKIELVFRADYKGDFVDRLYSVSLNFPTGSIELHRGITDLRREGMEFKETIESVEDITRYTNFLRGKQNFSILLTASKEGGWKGLVKVRFYSAYLPLFQPDVADVILPVFCLERFSSGEPHFREIEFPAGIKKAILTLFATGHGWNIGGEEYKLRRVIVKLDGEIIAKTKLIGWWYGLLGRAGWDQGQGRVPPYEFDVTDKIKPGIHEISVEIPEFEYNEKQPENNWEISLHFSIWTENYHKKVETIGSLIETEILIVIALVGVCKTFKNGKRKINGLSR